MNLRSKLVAGVATFALVGGLGLSSATWAADPVPGTPLTEVQSKDTIVGAKVKDNKGEAVGEVKSVKLDASGKIASVNVTVGTKTVALKADSLTYAQADNTLTSQQSKAELQKLPSM